MLIFVTHQLNKRVVVIHMLFCIDETRVTYTILGNQSKEFEAAFFFCEGYPL